MKLDGRDITVGTAVWDLSYEGGTVVNLTEDGFTAKFSNGTVQAYHMNGVHVLRGRRTLYNSRPFVSTPTGNTDLDVAMGQLLGSVEANVKRFGAN